MYSPQGIKQSFQIYQLSTPAGFNPADSTTYFIGGNGQMNTTEGVGRVYPTRQGVIKKCYVHFVQTAGSAEKSSISIRINNLLDLLVSNAVTNNASYTVFNNTSLPVVALTVGNFIELKWVTPAWVTNPTSVEISAVIYISHI